MASNQKIKASFNYEMLPKLPVKTRIFYSFGHIYNDLCASVWFSYTLLYFKLNFDDNTAGLLLLLGQVADAISTPLIGYASDKNYKYFICNYGRRKIWHLIGTICVALSFPFIFNACFVCDDSGFAIKFTYYASFIALFQFGWAAVQVAHVSLITDLTKVSSQRLQLNAYRQAATVAASICVYSITLLLLGVEETTISKKDTIVFMKVVHLITVIGIIFSILFHIFVREPPYNEKIVDTHATYTVADNAIEPNHLSVYREKAGSCYSINISQFGSNTDLNTNTKQNDEQLFENMVSLLEKDAESVDTELTKPSKKQKIWLDWLKSINFWHICFIYMMARLFVNLTQVYTPMYLQDSLRLPKRNIAIVPFVTYLFGFIFSLIAKTISKKVGSKFILIIGCTFGFTSCVWILIGGLGITMWQVFIVAALFGIGGTAMLIGSLALTADLIADNIVSGAFVFGSMSFFDKLVNGCVIAIIQHFNPLSQNNLNLADYNLDLIQENVLNVTETVLSTNVTQINYLLTLANVTSVNSTITGYETLEPVVVSVLYYLQILVYVSGTAVICTFFALLLAFVNFKFTKLSLRKIFTKRQK